ncbi:alpha/beta fold hydrolase [Sphingobacterium griseoflavum]|uniref:AB hydrolase-1 domain-containing protein n=1 Tax=Sphingobacterium griseoflavum TaxID=1474952 RepID=A0ABQ3HUV5_9SPHI|nr:alpha/beta hydrolase [Sphingobacterium griseoflavum]GHE28865.1 hypothetical protein GCM10017764_09300 [Sphingobacterium griseoflavum]
MKTYVWIVLYLLTITADGYSQIDTLIRINSCNLHFKVNAGAGKPILFESGGGLDHRQWDSIANILHENLHATTIIYDRQGFGKSEIDTVRYNILTEVQGLEDAIEQLGYDQSDMLLVSHSLGAFYSRLYAHRNPASVKGIIMFDPRIPTTDDVKFAKDIAKSLVRDAFGPEDIAWYYLLYRMAWNSNFLINKPVPASIPILNIMAAYGPFDTEEENNRFKSAQTNFVNSRKNATLLLAQGSSHNIPQDMPDYVIAEVAKFYRQYLGFDK